MFLRKYQSFLLLCVRGGGGGGGLLSSWTFTNINSLTPTFPFVSFPCFWCRFWFLSSFFNVLLPSFLLKRYFLSSLPGIILCESFPFVVLLSLFQWCKRLSYSNHWKPFRQRQLLSLTSVSFFITDPLPPTSTPDEKREEGRRLRSPCFTLLVEFSSHLVRTSGLLPLVFLTLSFFTPKFCVLSDFFLLVRLERVPFSSVKKKNSVTRRM